MDDDSFHFQIPDENIRQEKYEKSSGGKSYTRANHREHGIRLLASTNYVIAKESQKKDYDLVRELFLAVETPEELSVKSEKFKLENLGFELVDLSRNNQSLGIVKIQKKKLLALSTRLETYINT